MSSPTPTKVTIIGAGGHLGRHMVTSLDANPNFQISVVTRQHSSSCDTGANFLPHIPIYCIPSNTYDNAESQLVSILTGQDIVISAIATQAVGQQRTIIDAAIKAGVKLFIPSEFGHDTRNQRAAELLPEFVCKTKRGIVQYLQSKEDAGLKWTAFVTGPVFEMAIFHYLGFDVGTKNASILDDGTHCWSATTLSTVALAVKNALLIPEETANRYLFIESFNVSQKDALTALEGLTKKLWNAIFQDAEEEKRLAFEKLSKRNYGAIPMLMRYVTCIEGYGGDYMRYEEGANKLLSLPEERLADVLARMVGE